MKRQNSIVVFDGNLECERFSVVSHNFEGDIVIHGSLKVKGDVIFNGQLWVDGEIVVKGELEVSSITSNCIDCYGLGNVSCKEFESGDTDISGNLTTTEGAICVDDLTVGGDVLCAEYIDAENVNVGNDVSCQGDFQVDYGTVYIGGNLSCQDIYVDGDVFEFNIGGNLSCCDIQAGFVTVGGDICCQKTNVRSFHHCHNED